MSHGTKVPATDKNGGKSGLVLFLEKPVVRPIKSRLEERCSTTGYTGPFSHTDSVETASKIGMIPIQYDDMFN